MSAREAAVRVCSHREISLPTFSYMRNPLAHMSEALKVRLEKQGDMQAVDPLNLYRITWKNDASNGWFRDVPNFVSLPASVTGVEAPVVVLLGHHFPTNAHKVGAAFWPLVQELVMGNFNPETTKALWPSTGNYCRGGTLNSQLLGCHSIAVLPENMSRERFTWLEAHGSEIIRTPGSESDVKEVYDAAEDAEKKGNGTVHVFNQFSHFGNPLFHAAVTAPAMMEAVAAAHPEAGLWGMFACQGSAGILGAGERLRQFQPDVYVVAGEALQCPTLLQNGYGSHRIEGIGDKHVPWILNPRNLNGVAAIDDELVVNVARLWNEPAGQAALRGQGVPDELIAILPLFGFSAIANVIGCIKLAKSYSLRSTQAIVTVATDGMDLYQSHLSSMREKESGFLSDDNAYRILGKWTSITTDHMMELTQQDQRRIHNLKYFTWVEQRGKDVRELDEMWNDDLYWTKRLDDIAADKLIEEFNADVEAHRNHNQ